MVQVSLGLVAAIMRPLEETRLAELGRQRSLAPEGRPGSPPAPQRARPKGPQQVLQAGGGGGTVLISRQSVDI